MTRVFSPSMNLAVFAVPPAEDTDWPMPMASDEEKASTSIIAGWWLEQALLGLAR